MEGAVKGEEAELGCGGKGAEVGVGPILGGGAAEAREAAKDTRSPGTADVRLRDLRGFMPLAHDMSG